VRPGCDSEGAQVVTVYDAISLALASIAVFMSGYALWISVPLHRQQRRKLEEARARRQQADVRVRLVSSFGRRDRLVIENRGEGTARAVHLQIDPPEGRENPVPQPEYAEKLPIEELRDGESVELIAALSTDRGFNAKWSWQDEDGKRQEREERLSVQRAGL
jgi:hypothetical protein